MKVFALPLQLTLILYCYAAAAQASQPSSPTFPPAPTFAGSLHIKAVVHQKDIRSKADLNSDNSANLERNRASYAKRGMAKADVDKLIADQKATMEDAERPLERQVELWAQGDKWVLEEVDPSVKSDVFTGKSAGKTVWFCDGKYLMQIKDDGFTCTVFKPGTRIAGYFPFLPPIGVSYTAMPLYLPPTNIPPDLLAKAPKSPGWQIGSVPSFGQASGDRFEIDTVTTRFTNYTPGYMSLASVKGVERFAEVRVGMVNEPQERWVFDRFKSESGNVFALRTVWNDFRNGPQKLSRFLAKTQRTYEIQSIETSPIPESQFSRERLIEPEASIQVNANVFAGERPSFRPYQKGESWDSILADAPLKTAERAKLGLATYVGGAIGLGSLLLLGALSLRKQKRG